jgi:hypothetical protein
MPFIDLKIALGHEAEDQQLAKNVRKFVGEDKKFLPVPGLKELKAVRVGQNPEYLTDIEFETPTDATLKKFKAEKQPLFMTTVIDGVPHLLRNTLSNDGVFQKDESFYVHAVWEK